MNEFLDYQTQDVMTREVMHVSPETSLAEVEQIFETHDFNGLPVLDAKGGFVGIVTNNYNSDHHRLRKRMGAIFEASGKYPSSFWELFKHFCFSVQNGGPQARLCEHGTEESPQCQGNLVKPVQSRVQTFSKCH